MTEAKRIEMVDEFGALSDELARIAPAIQRHALLKAEIESWYRQEPPDENYVAVGTRYEVQIGVREFRRKITTIGMTRLFTVLGKVKFLGLCTFPLTLMDQVTTIADQNRICEKNRTGPRSIKSVALVIEAPAKQQSRRKPPAATSTEAVSA
jgi:hypothetical protein